MSEDNTRKEKLLIIGAGGFGRMAAEQAIQEYDCAFVDDGYEVGAIVCGIPVAGHVSDLAELRKTYSNLIVGTGNNKFRESVYQKADALEYKFPNIVSASAYISPFANIGHGCVILQNVCIQNGAEIGNGILLNAGVELHCDSFVDDYTLIYANSVIRTGAKVGKHVRIGSNTTICNHIVIADGTDVPDCTAID